MRQLAEFSPKIDFSSRGGNFLPPRGYDEFRKKRARPPSPPPYPVRVCVKMGIWYVFLGIWYFFFWSDFVFWSVRWHPRKRTKCPFLHRPVPGKEGARAAWPAFCENRDTPWG